MKHVVVHIGPHKTGSTAIQQSLTQHAKGLAQHGIAFVHDAHTHKAAMAIAREDYDTAEALLAGLARQFETRSEATILLSQEDFAGELPGRTRRKQIYPRLTKNIRVIRRALKPNKVSFVFFERPETDWLRSCYVQNLKHRTKFHAFDDFVAWFDPDFTWAEKLAKPRETVGEELACFAYDKTADAGVRKLLEYAGLAATHMPSFASAPQANVSPQGDLVRKLEHINKVSEFPQTAWFAKDLVMSGWTPRMSPKDAKLPTWPPMQRDPTAQALPKLGERVRQRVHKYTVTDVLPDPDAPLEALVFNLLPEDAELPDTSREQMEDQANILKYHLRGKSHLAFLNALTISYLRRSTKHSEKARALFHRIWQEHGVFLINELSTRWLISTLQTFLDHGQSEAQRQIGTAGYFYANMMKIHEGERAIEGLGQGDATDQSEPSTKNGFRGLDRFKVGGTDLMLNTNALLLEIAQKDDVAGLVLQEFLLRVKTADNVFTRLDKARADQGIKVAGFTDTWSFFDPVGE